MPVDKPPLTFYSTALSFKLFSDPSEWAARLPNFYASTLSLAVLWSLARRLYQSRPVALLAMLILALAPLPVAFSGTVYTDPQVTLWVLLACLMAVRNNWGWAGLFAGLAFASKQSAIQFVPLILALGIALNHHQLKLKLLRFSLVFGVMLLAPFLWDMMRLDSANWWALGSVNNSPGRFIRADEVNPRLNTLWNTIRTGLGNSFPAALLLSSVILLLAALKKRTARRQSLIDIILLAYCLGYVAVYWLIAFNLYDRYLYPLLPLFALLIARGLTELPKLLNIPQSRRTTAVLLTILLLVMLPTAVQTRSAQTPLNTVNAHHSGIVETANYLNTLPPGTIVYDHWLGWLLGWYTGQNRPPDMWLRSVYYPTPETLVAGALQQPDPLPRYFVVPDWAWSTPWLPTLIEADITLEIAAHYGQFTIYRLEMP
ncbi:ArnT family glycosyltransferase [Chloroflexota bacterium]